MNDLEFRQISVKDIALIAPLWEKLRAYHRSRTAYFQRYYDGMRFEKRIEKFLGPGMLVRIDLCGPAGGGEAIGYCVSTLNQKKEGEIDSLYVGEPYRRRGIAGSFVAGALEWLDNEGAGEVRVMVAAGNDEALRFYEKFGLCPAYTIMKKRPAEE
jgi:diamine N-acetyltransferase